MRALALLTVLVGTLATAPAQGATRHCAEVPATVHYERAADADLACAGAAMAVRFFAGLGFRTDTPITIHIVDAPTTEIAEGYNAPVHGRYDARTNQIYVAGPGRRPAARWRPRRESPWRRRDPAGGRATPAARSRSGPRRRYIHGPRDRACRRLRNCARRWRGRPHGRRIRAACRRRRAGGRPGAAGPAPAHSLRRRHRSGWCGH